MSTECQIVRHQETLKATSKMSASSSQNKRKRITCLFPNQNLGPFWEPCESQPGWYFRPKKEVMSGKKEDVCSPWRDSCAHLLRLEQEVSLKVQKNYLESWFPLSTKEPGLYSGLQGSRQVESADSHCGRRRLRAPVGFCAHSEITEPTRELRKTLRKGEA